MITSLEAIARWLDSALPIASAWRAQVYAYCERGPSSAFWAEPANAVTNFAFHLAAIVALVLWACQPSQNRRAVDVALIALVFVIGTGSFLFHTLATRWAAIADTAPIGIFMVAYLGYAVKRWVQFGWLATLAALALFFVALWQSSVIRCGGGPCLNGSVAYFPAFAALVVIGGYLSIRRHPAGKYLIAAGLIFAASLAFRTLDRTLCPYTIVLTSRPWGTHFLWHLLNATLLYLLLQAAVLHGGRRIGDRP